MENTNTKNQTPAEKAKPANEEESNEGGCGKTGGCGCM